MAKLVSKVYGDALFEESIEKQSVDTLFHEVKALLAIWRENRELAELLDSKDCEGREDRYHNEYLRRPGVRRSDGFSGSHCRQGQTEGHSCNLHVFYRYGQRI